MAIRVYILLSILPTTFTDTEKMDQFLTNYIEPKPNHDKIDMIL